MQTNDPDDPFADMDPQACPTAESMEVIGTQWRLNVLHDLQDGEMRFNELDAWAREHVDPEDYVTE